ncbi:MAG: hypothetical protein ACLFPU_05515 [Dehalococcoidia bacterium]
MRELTLTFTWVDPTHTLDLPALSLTGFDFLFGIAFILGLFTLNTIVSLKEEG